MFTIFSLFELCGFLLGGFLLGKTGYELAGIVGAVPGGLLGAVVGRAIGRLPLLLAVKWVRRKLARKSSAQLRRELHDPGFGALNFNLLELKSRGEDVSCELPIVLDALASPDRGRRGFGWAALTSAFPDLVAEIPAYRLRDSVQQCEQKLANLRERAAQEQR